MKLVSEVRIEDGSETKRIQLLSGDITQLGDEFGSDALIVSAFQENYLPVRGSVIGALDGRGVSVGRLAETPDLDLRHVFSCWVSDRLSDDIAPGFDRLVCLESGHRGDPPEIVHDLFRALCPLALGPPRIKSVCLPILGTGQQGYSISQMLPLLLEAAADYLREGLPLDYVRFVVLGEDELTLARNIFEAFRNDAQGLDEVAADADSYHLFISYCHKDAEAARLIRDEVTKNGFRVFLDTDSLDFGMSWQRKLYRSLENSRAMTALFTPDYLSSRMCQNEFDCSMIVAGNRGTEFVYPLLLRDTRLPAYYSMTQYLDCRPGSESEVSRGAAQIIRRLNALCG